MLDTSHLHLSNVQRRLYIYPLPAIKYPKEISIQVLSKKGLPLKKLIFT